LFIWGFSPRSLVDSTEASSSMAPRQTLCFCHCSNGTHLNLTRWCHIAATTELMVEIMVVDAADCQHHFLRCRIDYR
jgi:hypothetical protein